MAKTSKPTSGSAEQHSGPPGTPVTGDTPIEARVVTVGPFQFPASTALAQALVDPDHNWSWVEDGPVLKGVGEFAYDELRAQAEPALNALGFGWPQTSTPNLIAILGHVVKAWDDLFGWDAKNMTEHTEDMFYEFLAKAIVNKRRSEGK